MTFLTLFSAPKPFTNPHINIIQRNAIETWTRLGRDVEVILTGDEAGMGEVAAEMGVSHIAEVARNEWGTPLVSSIFSLVREASDSPYLAYVNADILLLPDFIEITRQIAAQSQEFLVVGQRWDVEITELMDFGKDWDQVLKTYTKNHGELHLPAGSDFFIFSRVLFKDMPEFAIGRAGWDNWMIYEALNIGCQVIDATPSLMVIHQNHDYSHLPGGVPHYDLEETRINAALGGGLVNMYMTLDTNYELIDGIIKRPRWTRDRILRRLERWLRPKDDEDRGIRWRLARRFRRMRRGIF
jgi:hypothetical protein